MTETPDNRMRVAVVWVSSIAKVSPVTPVICCH